jgi:Domain of unknown function (DUF4260)
MTDSTVLPVTGLVTGAPHILLRLEGAAMLLAATIVYSHFAAGWLMFAVLFLVPDVFMLGYLLNRRWGAVVYNAGHTYLVPASLFAVGFTFNHATAIALSLIWIGHIGFDRMLGYGLKYATGFKFSHLGSPPA